MRSKDPVSWLKTEAGSSSGMLIFTLKTVVPQRYGYMIHRSSHERKGEMV